MKIAKYFWEVSPPTLKKIEKILKNPEHPEFKEKMFTLLSRCDEPRVLFSLISKTQFINVWPGIKRYWKKRKLAPDFIAWWDTIYENLIEKTPKISYSEFSIKIGKMLRKRRLEIGLNQSEFAKMARMKQPDISAIELGKKNITLETLEKLCRILNFKDIILK